MESSISVSNIYTYLARYTVSFTDGTSLSLYQSFSNCLSTTLNCLMTITMNQRGHRKPYLTTSLIQHKLLKPNNSGEEGHNNDIGFPLDE